MVVSKVILCSVLLCSLIAFGTSKPPHDPNEGHHIRSDEQDLEQFEGTQETDKEHVHVLMKKLDELRDELSKYSESESKSASSEEGTSDEVELQQLNENADHGKEVLATKKKSIPPVLSADDEETLHALERALHGDKNMRASGRGRIYDKDDFDDGEFEDDSRPMQDKVRPPSSHHREEEESRENVRRALVLRLQRVLDMAEKMGVSQEELEAQIIRDYKEAYQQQEQENRKSALNQQQQALDELTDEDLRDLQEYLSKRSDEAYQRQTEEKPRRWRLNQRQRLMDELTDDDFDRLREILYERADERADEAEERRRQTTVQKVLARLTDADYARLEEYVDGEGAIDDYSPEYNSQEDAHDYLEGKLFQRRRSQLQGRRPHHPRK